MNDGEKADPIDDHLTPGRELWKIEMKHHWRGRSMAVGVDTGWKREANVDR